MRYDQWKRKAYENRVRILDIIHEAQSGHPGGSLSIIDVLTVLYEMINHKPKQPNWKDRDRVVLSAGHLCPALYTVLARHGYFSEELLETLRTLDSPVTGHPEKGLLPGIENTSGPLGQGLSVACGMAKAAQLNHEHHKVFCITSDGEHDEGATWEAAQFAAHHKLGNLINIIDRNNIQIGGHTSKVLKLGSLKDKYEAFGWNVLEIDGHNFELIKGALDYVKHRKNNKPLCIIAHTTLGKGVSFMRDNPAWHGKAPNDDELVHATQELLRFLRSHHLKSELLKRGACQ